MVAEEDRVNIRSILGIMASAFLNYVEQLDIKLWPLLSLLLRCYDSYWLILNNTVFDYAFNVGLRVYVHS